jgi:hypothetical protein
MNWLSFLFNSRETFKSEEKIKLTVRQGEAVQVDNVFEAWTSGDLSEMLKSVQKKTNPIDRHFLLQNIVNETYKLRKGANHRETCIKYSEIHLAEFPVIAPALKKDLGGYLPRVTTFQNYATVLTEIGEYEKAIKVCEDANSFGLDDGTKSGYQGRIERIKRKQETYNS